MYVIDVIPLSHIGRNQPQLLTYFHPTPLAFGAHIKITIGHRRIEGIVASHDHIRNRKLDLRKLSEFQLKSIEDIINPKQTISQYQVALARYLAESTQSPLGLCLKTILPAHWGKKGYTAADTLTPATATRYVAQYQFVSSNLKEHAQDYQEVIAKCLEQPGNQVFLMVPEITMAQYFMRHYAHWQPVLVTGGLSPTKSQTIWQNIANGTVRLIIGTRSGLFLPFCKLALIIIDDEANEAYYADNAPRYHAPRIAAKVAELHQVPIIAGSNTPRPETLEYYQETSDIESSPTAITVINMIQERKDANFSIFSRELKDQIEESQEQKTNLLLYIPRRGHNALLACETCGQSVRCSNCSVALVPHQAYGQQLRCHHCNQHYDHPKQCASCSSYRLKPFGIGIEKVIDELKKYLDRRNITPPPIIQFDSETANTSAKEEEIMTQWRAYNSSILIATQAIFSYKYEVRFPAIGVINADTLINIPDFRSEERLARQLITLAQMTDHLMIQTQNLENPAIQAIMPSQYVPFLTGELESRKLLGYPPFQQLIKVTFQHKNLARARDNAVVTYEKLRQGIERLGIRANLSEPSPAFVSQERGLYIWQILIKIGLADIKKRNQLLSYLPNDCVLEINPKNTI